MPSTAIRHIDYDQASQRLRVRFVSGQRYEYEGVPPPVHRSFVESGSKGRFFQAEIRDRYPFRRLDS
ncbi:KTSC domain-containing protein [Phenylobacterium sp.]|uniref:KTSC domain-containing protein n=1 Tax=Phenylobacterium sp. TaxID=1871053 RepID=UPI002F9367E3